MKVYAGNQEKGDIYIEIELPKNVGPLEASCVEVNSRYQSLFGNHLNELLKSLAIESGLGGLCIRAIDNGAWDYTVKARFEYCIRQLRELL
jgi:citrate lyase gamma subunit